MEIVQRLFADNDGVHRQGEKEKLALQSQEIIHLKKMKYFFQEFVCILGSIPKQILLLLSSVGILLDW